jgi:hypothetical protein
VAETTGESGPAQIVNRRVVVNVRDAEEEDFLPFISVPRLKPEDGKIAEKTEPPGEELEAIQEDDIRKTMSSPPSFSSSRRAVRNQPIGKRTKVVIDIEDFAALDVNPAGGSESSSKSPHTVERRRWTKNEEGWSRPHEFLDDSGCGLSKDYSKSCSLFGQFADCAMCPRGRGSSFMSEYSQDGRECIHEGGQTCAACNCGLKVVARNTFLTISNPHISDEQVGSRIRSKST